MAKEIRKNGQVLPGLEPGLAEDFKEIRIRCDNHYTTKPVEVVRLNKISRQRNGAAIGAFTPTETSVPSLGSLGRVSGTLPITPTMQAPG